MLTPEPISPSIAPPWKTYAGKYAIAHAPEGSFASRRAIATLRQVDRAAGALEELLSPLPNGGGPPLDIYLIDPVAGASPGTPADAHDGTGHPPFLTTGEDAIVYVVQPEDAGDLLPALVARLLIRRWFDQNASGAWLFALGMAGFVSDRTGVAGVVREADDWVRKQRAAGQPVSILDELSPEAQSDPAQARARYMAATSFVAFLVRSFGPGPLRQFLASYDPQRRDQAAASAYQQPLAALEQAWLAELEQRGSRAGTFRVFVRHFLPLLKPYWPRQLEVVGYMIYGLIFALALPFSAQLLVDDIIPKAQMSKNLDRLLQFVVVLLVLFVLDALIGLRRQYVNYWINQHILFDLQLHMFSHLQELTHDFFARAKIGDIMTRFSTDLQIVQAALAQAVGTAGFMALSATAAAIALLWLNTALAGIVLLVVPLFAVSYILVQSRLESAVAVRQRKAGEISAALEENLAGHAVIKAFGLEQSAKDTYKGRQLNYLKSALRVVLFGALYEGSTVFATSLGQVVVLGAGGYLVITGRMSVGTLLAFIWLVPLLFRPVATLAGAGQSLQMASASLDRVAELLDEPVRIADKPGAAVLAPLASDVRLQHVTFRYEQERPVLKDLNLTIEAGRNAAIVGPSGSGKSTVVNLLMRFWDPDEGSVLVDGHDLRDVQLSSLRGQIGLVFQDTFIFDTTIRGNIAMGKSGATDAEIAAVARAAQLDDYIRSLPAGYDTVLGERGVRMSGGQKQRLALARAMIRNPSILILDEATSALDANTEGDILATLQTFARGRTTISITHRLSIAARADRIYVLDDGELVEEGTHDELVSAGGLYQSLYEEQVVQTAAGAEKMLAKVARLQAIPLFAGLSNQELSTVARRVSIERFAAGENIIEQGETGDRFFIINRGRVDILVRAGTGQSRVNSLEDGDYFGEMALLTDEPRTATVRATTPTELYYLDKAEFRSLLDNEPGVRAAIEATIASRRAALASITSIVATKSA